MTDTHVHDPANVTNPEHADHHIVTPLQYCYVYGGLLLGTIITIWAADQNFGIFNPVIALAIASTKMVIVILFFMHVKYQSNLVRMTVACGFFTFLVLVTMTLTDYMSRAWGSW
jgi:cytochrome c oxidase subunit 4